jgi:hypothetical protein
MGSSERAGGVTWRAVFAAIIIIVLTSPAAFYGEIVWGGSVEAAWGTGAPGPWPVSLLFLMTAAMALPVLRRMRFTRRELLTVYSVVIVATPLTSRTVLFYVLPKVVLYYYMARAYPIWETTWLTLVPSWFAPSSAAAIEAFGLGQAWVPWSLWAVPLAMWGSFMVALFGASLCLVAILQRQWVTNERLAFPLAQIPLETVREPATGAAGGLPVAWPFWAGFIGSLAFSFVSGLSRRIPALPAIPSAVPIMEWQGVGPLAGLGRIELLILPWLVALAYIIPKELSFSVWFLWIVRILLTVVAIAAGATPQLPEDWWRSDFPAPYHQAFGALVALGLWGFWIARRHIAHVLKAAVRWGGESDDAGEALPYRWAVIGFVCCFAWLVVFFMLAGCRMVFGLAFVALVVGAYLVYARVQADTALNPITWHLHDALLTPIGSRALQPREVISLITMCWLTFPVPESVFSVCSINALTSFKIADAAQINLRRLTYAMLGGFAVSLGVGVFVMMTGLYHYGFFNTGSGTAPYWPSLMSRHDGNAIQYLITNPSGPDVHGILGFIAGAVVCVALGVLRLRFWWWPLHPVGYIVAMGWGQSQYTFPFFFGWAAKALVIRYGGLRLYRWTVPLAIGVIVGDLLNATIWSVIGLVSQGRI